MLVSQTCSALVLREMFLTVLTTYLNAEFKGIYGGQETKWDVEKPEEGQELQPMFLIFTKI